MKKKPGQVLQALQQELQTRLPRHLRVRPEGDTGLRIELADDNYPGTERTVATVGLQGTLLRVARRGRPDVKQYDLNDPSSLAQFEEHLDRDIGIKLN